MMNVYEKIEEFSEKVRATFNPSCSQKKWNFIKDGPFVHFGSPFRIIITYFENQIFLDVSVKRGPNNEEPTKEEKLTIYQLLVSYLESERFDGYFVYHPYRQEGYTFIKGTTKRPATPIGEQAKKTYEIGKILGKKFHFPHDNKNYLTFEPNRNHKSYRVFIDNSQEQWLVGLEGQKKQLFKTAKEVQDYYKEIAEKTITLNAFVDELAILLTKYDATSYYNKEKGYLFIMNKKIPFFAQIGVDGRYMVRLFYKTIQHKDVETLKEKVQTFAVAYIKENRIKNVLQVGVFTVAQQFYLKVFGVHTKEAEKMILNRVRTSMSFNELFQLIEQEVHSEIKPLPLEKVEEFKKQNKLRHKLKDGFTIGSLQVYRSASTAFIEKN